MVKLRQKISEKSLLRRFFESHFEHFDVVFEMNSSKMGKKDQNQIRANLLSSQMNQEKNPFI